LNETFTEEQIESGRGFFAGPKFFVMGVAAIDGLPTSTLPEIALAGRSNVGKSSLINALCGVKDLARTSSTPGRTRELNFFNIGDALHLVDMPGYGYAEAPKAEIKKWQALLRAYLRGRPGLIRAFALIDARHGVKDVDKNMFDLLDEAAVTYQLVLTKIDKLKLAELQKSLASAIETARRRPAAFPKVLATSSETGAGIAELRAKIAGLVSGRG
jgi:GTP-binding protein